MIDRDESPKLWIGKIYLVEEDEQVNLGGLEVSFAKLITIDY